MVELSSIRESLRFSDLNGREKFSRTIAIVLVLYSVLTLLLRYFFHFFLLFKSPHRRNGRYDVDPVINLEAELVLAQWYGFFCNLPVSIK